MITHLLDTSVYCQPLKKQPHPSVIQQWMRVGDSALCTSIFCETEILQGLELKNSEKLWQAYREILKERLPILPFDMRVAETYARLQADSIKHGLTRPIFDLLIASTAIAHELILAACNYRDFVSIPDLRVEDWLA